MRSSARRTLAGMRCVALSACGLACGTAWATGTPRPTAIGKPDALWVYGSGILILLISYGRTMWRGRTKAAPETEISPIPATKP